MNSRHNRRICPIVCSQKVSTETLFCLHKQESSSQISPLNLFPTFQALSFSSSCISFCLGPSLKSIPLNSSWLLFQTALLSAGIYLGFCLLPCLVSQSQLQSRMKIPSFWALSWVLFLSTPDFQPLRWHFQQLEPIVWW